MLVPGAWRSFACFWYFLAVMRSNARSRIQGLAADTAAVLAPAVQGAPRLASCPVTHLRERGPCCMRVPGAARASPLLWCRQPWSLARPGLLQAWARSGEKYRQFPSQASCQRADMAAWKAGGASPSERVTTGRVLMALH